MPYKPTGKPPGRPRKPDIKPSEPEALSYQEVAGEADGDIANPPKRLARTRRVWREHYERLGAAHPDAIDVYDRRGRHLGKRPILTAKV